MKHKSRYKCHKYACIKKQGNICKDTSAYAAGCAPL